MMTYSNEDTVCTLGFDDDDTLDLQALWIMLRQKGYQGEGFGLRHIAKLITDNREKLNDEYGSVVVLIDNLPPGKYLYLFDSFGGLKEKLEQVLPAIHLGVAKMYFFKGYAFVQVIP